MSIDVKDYRWVSCSKEMSWAASEYRHLINTGGLTTVCGHSASHTDIWRTNSTKLNCEQCMVLGKDILKAQTEELLRLADAGLPRTVRRTVEVSVQLVEEKPVSVSVIPAGEMSRATAGGLARAALEEMEFYDLELDSDGFSTAGAFFTIREGK